MPVMKKTRPDFKKCLHQKKPLFFNPVFNFCCYLRGREKERAIHQFTPQMLGQVKTRSQEFNPSLPHRWQGPSSLGHYRCLRGSALPGSWSQRLEACIKLRHSVVGGRHSSLLTARQSPTPKIYLLILISTNFLENFGICNCLLGISISMSACPLLS